MSCSAPYALTQDCSSWWGGSRVLTIQDVDVAVTATQDGATVVLLDAHPAKNILLSNPLVLNSPNHSRAANTAYGVVRDVLEKSGFQILRSIPVKTFADTSGYVLHLNGNGYEVLKAYTVKLRGSAAK